MVILLKYFGPNGIKFMTVFTTLDFPVILNGEFSSRSIKDDRKVRRD
jgi:hypothetical protein